MNLRKFFSRNLKFRFSTLCLIVCCGFMLWLATSFYPRWNKTRTEATISWDVSGYYMYLPAIFIYDDLNSFRFLDTVLIKYNPTPDPQQIHVIDSNNKVIKYSCGQAITMLPWFLLSHAYALNSNRFEADGFSFPYQWGIGFGMFIYALIGLYLLRRFLLYYFSDSVTGVVLLLLVFGSNYLNYSSIDQAMTHNVLFVIYTCILLLTRNYYEGQQQYKHLIGLGFFCGLAALIRPTEIIAMLIPLTWGLASWKDINERIKIFGGSLQRLISFFLPILILGSLQLLYWKIYSGSWFVYSYGNQQFSWRHPHVMDFLFHYKSGWLLYCPLLIMVLPGMLIMLFKFKNGLLYFLFSSLAFYITTAWDVWDYGGNSGRAMVQYYPFLFIAIACLLQFCAQKRIRTVLLMPVLILGIYINLWWTYHAHAGEIQVSGASKEYYWKTIGKWQSNNEILKLLDNNYIHEKEIVSENVVYTNDFEKDTSAFVIEKQGNHCLELNAQHQKSNLYSCTLPVGAKVIRASAQFACSHKEWEISKQTQFILRFYRQNTEVQSNLIRVFRFLNSGERKVIWLDAICPKDYDLLTVSFWNAGSQTQIWIDDLKVSVIE